MLGYTIVSERAFKLLDRRIEELSRERDYWYELAVRLDWTNASLNRVVAKLRARLEGRGTWQ